MNAHRLAPGQRLDQHLRGDHKLDQAPYWDARRCSQEHREAHGRERIQRNADALAGSMRIKWTSGPLRRVVGHRMGKGAGWDVLECGHKKRAPGSRVSKRRRCRECLDARR